MRSKAIVTRRCCGQEKVRLGAAAYVRVLLEEALLALYEAARVVKIPCDNCARLMLVDAGTIGIGEVDGGQKPVTRWGLFVRVPNKPPGRPPGCPDRSSRSSFVPLLPSSPPLAG
jgi:hypothetical protein